VQPASQKYKELMRREFRDPFSYIRVTIGLINQQAQASAYVPDKGSYAYYSSFKMPLDNYEVKELYATCDRDYTAVDGSMYFLPRERSDVVLNQGLVSKDLLGPIEIRFPIEYDIKGLTIEFGKAYPVDFVIESDNNTVAIKGNIDGHFVTEEIFNGATFLRFTPSTMINGQSRFRIHKITMGIGIYFDNRKILSATKKEHISPIMEELPTIDFNLTVNNKDRAFDIENAESSVNFLEIGQDITVLYGQELDDGSVEWLPGATVQLNEWSADDEQMEFTATDRFEGMDGTYYRGLYRPEGICLYDMAVDVFSDAKVDSRTYWIDPYLKTVKVSNPMPVVSHKEALQLIANVGRCILYQDREGIIFLKSSFIPDMTTGSSSETYFSNVGAVLDKTVKKSYAMAAQDYSNVRPAQYFLPKKQTLRYSPNANGSNMTEERQANSQYVGVGYMPREVYEHENLYTGTKDFSGVWRNSSGWTYTANGYEDFIVAQRSINFSGLCQNINGFKDEVYTCSAFLNYSSPAVINPAATTGYTGGAGGTALVNTKTPTKPDTPNTWVRFYFSFTLLTDGIICPSFEPANSTGLLKVCGVKVEKGAMPTAWTPAPSDWLADPNNFEWIPIQEYENRYLNTGYVSEAVAESDGSFAIKPTVEITLEASFKCFGLTLEFGDNNPAEMIFHAFRSGELVEDYIVTGLTATTVIGHEFEEFDRLILEFTKGCPNNRVILNNITFGDSTDYIFEYGHELAKTPKGTQLAKVRELQVIRTVYNQTSEVKELAKETIAVTSADNRYTFYFSNPVYDLSCALIEPERGQTVTIVESSNYFVTVEITGATGAVEVTVSGREYLTSQTKVSRQLNPTGSLETWENPLVSDMVHAADLTDWIGDYMKADREYDLQYRGEPRIDANDIAFLENKYVPDLLLRVYEHTLKFNGALSGTIKARRDMSHVAATKN
jgi:hypothetical protein